MCGTPFEGQTIGSLLVRLAWDRGDSPATMTQRMGLGWSIWTRDMDRSLGDLAVQRISHATSLPCDEVRAMTLTKRLQDAGIPTQRNGFQQWLTPVGIYHRKRLRYGQLFCPVCLQDGSAPLRLAWRLASNWVCIAHAILLRDGCAQCGAPFAPMRHDALMLARCDRCLAPLHTPVEMAPQNECHLQEWVHSLWNQALAGDGQRLAMFHEAITTAVRRDPQFRLSGEPWTFWRVAERRELLVKVAQAALEGPALPLAPMRDAAVKKASKPGRRRCAGLPADPAARAARLIQLAARVRFARRPKARIARNA